MNKTRTILTVVMVALLTCAFTLPPPLINSNIRADIAPSQAAAEGLVRLVFSNKTGATIPLLTLEGPQNYYFWSVPVGKSTYYVAKAKYQIKYTACGRNRSKTMAITSNTKFATVNCPVVNITIKNNTGGNLRLSLDGPADYWFTIPPGTTRITILRGTYKYTAYASCGAISGTKKFKGKVNWYWWCR